MPYKAKQIRPAVTSDIKLKKTPTPWERGVRIGLVAQDAAPASAAFERFEMQKQEH